MTHNMLSLFVTYDQFGVPEKCTHFYMTGEDRSPLDTAFINYLEQEHKSMRRGEPIHDLQVCRYDIASRLIDEDRLGALSSNPRDLQEFIHQNHLTPAYDFSLRKYGAINHALGRFAGTIDLETLKAYMDPDHPLRNEFSADIDECMESLRDAGKSNSCRLNAIETAQGVLLFPDRAETKDRELWFLQYVADRYFTPKARQIGYLRFYHIDHPTEEQTRIASQSGYMFSLHDRSFLRYNALWYHSSVPLVKETEGCRYDLKPTYEAFRNFTEDHHLTISPKNDQIFNLIFIAEMGCPQNFQTDSRYAHYRHRFFFRAMDDWLRMTRSKDPSNESLFYKIQNQQQELARDILLAIYGVTIPELKLTGPTASQHKGNQEAVRRPSLSLRKQKLK